MPEEAYNCYLSDFYTWSKASGRSSCSVLSGNRHCRLWKLKSEESVKSGTEKDTNRANRLWNVHIQLC